MTQRNHRWWSLHGTADPRNYTELHVTQLNAPHYIFGSHGPENTAAVTPANACATVSATMTPVPPAWQARLSPLIHTRRGDHLPRHCLLQPAQIPSTRCPTSQWCDGAFETLPNSTILSLHQGETQARSDDSLQVAVSYTEKYIANF